MSLEDKNKDLYEKGAQQQTFRHEESIFDPASSHAPQPLLFEEKKWWEKARDLLAIERPRAILFGVIAVGMFALVGIIIVGAVLFQRSFFSDERVIVRVEGPEEVESNVPTHYNITIENKNRASLHNAEIILSYPENFEPENTTALTRTGARGAVVRVGTIDGKASQTITVNGKFFGPRNFVISLVALARYTPKNAGTTYEARSQTNVRVTSSPITLDVAAPFDAAEGDVIEYVITYRNESARSFADQRIVVTYPDGFIFREASPRPQEGNNAWIIGAIGENGTGSLRVRGTMRAAGQSTKVLTAAIGVRGAEGQLVAYNKTEHKIAMLFSPLFVAQTVNNTTDIAVSAKQKLTYRIAYRNDGTVGLRDVILTLDLESRALDFSRLELRGGGSYDGARNQIVWKAVDVPAFKNLEPGAFGEVMFTVPVKDVLPAQNADDRDFTIRSVARIDSPDVPTPIGRNKIIASNDLLLKVNSPVTLAANGFYYDARIVNTGPLPPRVGTETTYTLRWTITNATNDLERVRVEAFLPSDVVWKGVVDPAGENVTFNERTQQIVWDIGKAEAGVGTRLPERTIRFQVGITPSENQLRRAAHLLEQSILTAHDLFTGEDLRAEDDIKTTQLNEDRAIPSGAYQIAPSS